MKLPVFNRNLRTGLLLLLFATALAGAGCSSTNEPRNASSKPWNSPEGWQRGSIPGTMTQPR